MINRTMNRRMDLPEISLSDIRDRIVSRNTLKSYLVDNFYFILWCFDNLPEVLTVHGVGNVAEYRSHCPFGATMQVLFRENKQSFIEHLREAEVNAIINLEVLTPRMFMDYVRQLRNLRNGTYLSRSAYGNRRAGLFHLYRLHNNVGFDPVFSQELTLLYRGFFSNLTGMVGESQLVVDADNAEANDGIVERPNRINFNGWQWNSDESKRPMSVDLLKSICGWLLERGTPDAVWTQCYLLMAWNLCCRSNNVAYLKMSDINWASSFDSFCVHFAHSKTDQTGKESRYPRHIYANPTCVQVCAVTSLAFYFTCCFNIDRVSDCSLLFPGDKQESRFAKNLFAVLVEHEPEVRAMGFELGQIGSHSIRKGAATYLTSLVGGPPAAAISIRGGWTMGNVKERYFKYMEAGDQFVGRCLSLLPMLTEEMAPSPPFFDVPPDTPDDVWVTDTVSKQFPVSSLIVGFGRLSRMCAASMLHHRNWVFANFNPNHCVIICSHVYRDKSVYNFLTMDGDNKVKVTYPWNDNRHVFTGVAPHVALLQDLHMIRTDQQYLIDSFVDKVKIALSEYGVGSD